MCGSDAQPRLKAYSDQPHTYIPACYASSYCQGGADEQLYNEADLDATMEKIEVIDFLQTVQVNGIMVRGVNGIMVRGVCCFMRRCSVAVFKTRLGCGHGTTFRLELFDHRSHFCPCRSRHIARVTSWAPPCSW